jgi:hypothetical protein
LWKSCAELGQISSGFMGRGHEAKTRSTEKRAMSLLTATLFEVMDKEWPLWFVLLGFLGVGLVGMLVCRKWPPVAVLVLAWIIYGGMPQVLELNDDYVGPAMRNEAGLWYVILSYVSIGAGILLPLIGAWQGRSQRKSRKKSASIWARGKRHSQDWMCQQQKSP